MIGLPSDCDYETTIQIDSNGAFSVIHPLVLLPGNNTTEHNIYAYGLDQYGNRTSNSNLVKVTYTVNPPFNSVSILPAFTGVNNEADYQIIINKLNNNEEITQADIDSLRSVVFRSDVSQGTETVLFGFAKHTNLTALPASTQYNYLGYINGNNQTNLYKIYNNNVSNCNATNCIWDFIYPVPNMTGGGIYEIEFTGKLGTAIQKQTAGLTVDANIPTSPLILDIDKFINPNQTNANFVESKFYSNSNNILIKGVADANASITIIDQNGNTLCTTTTSSIGLWSCNTIIAIEGEFVLNTIATLGANSTESVQDATLVIDTTAPTITKLEDQNPWQRSGTNSEILIQSNEKMIYSYISDNSGNGCTNSAYMNNTKKDFILSVDRVDGNTSFTIPGNSIEGKYCLTATISDLAGNTATRILELYIDNTIPSKPTIDKTDWGAYNGKSARNLIPSLGRLTPEYIINDNIITIKGLAEEYSKVELYVINTVNSGLILPDRNSSACGSYSSDNIRDGVMTKSAYLCQYSFTYTFNTEKGYLFYVKSTDRAGNIAPLSEDEIVYYDKTNPITPETVSVDVIDWIYARNQDVIASNLGTGNSGKLPITNKEKIAIMDYAESRSDTEYWLYPPTGQLLKNNLIQKAGNGVNFRDADLNQGDGVYTFEATSWDAAGNKSGVHKWQVEKDEVKPVMSNVKVKICGFSICSYITGEIGSEIMVNGRSFGKLSKDNQIVILVSRWQYARTYTFDINLRDRAGNDGEVVRKDVKTGLPGIGGILGTADDRYAGLDSSVFDNEHGLMDIFIGQDGVIKIKDMVIPAPKLTYTFSPYGENKSITYGVAVREGQTLKFDADVSIDSGKNIKQALDSCRTKYIWSNTHWMLEIVDYSECISRYLGVDKVSYLDHLKEKFSKEKTEGGCKIKERFLFVEWDAIDSVCLLDNSYSTRTSKRINIPIPHAQVLFYGNEVEMTDKRITCSGAECIKPWWTFSPQDKIEVQYGMDTLPAGSKIKAKLKVYTDTPVEFNLFDNNYSISSSEIWGRESGFSNELEIKKMESLIVDLVHPLSADPNCLGFTRSSGYGDRSYWLNGVYVSDTHTGIDLAKPEGCKINTISDGRIGFIGPDTFSNNAHTVRVDHANSYNTLYLHGNGEYFVSFGQRVKSGDFIMYMGCSGNCSGTHLHLALRLNRNYLNPEDIMGDLSASGNLYVTTKKY